jgi:hypothetical protein
VAIGDTAALSEVEVGEVLEMIPANADKIISEINHKLRSFPFWPFAVVVFGVILYFAFLNALSEYYCYAIATLGIVLIFATAYSDKIRRTVVIVYDLDEAFQHAFSLLCEAFDKIAACSKIWNINTTGAERDWKRHAGAQRVIDRSSAKFSDYTPSIIKTNANIPL